MKRIIITPVSIVACLCVCSLSVLALPEGAVGRLGEGSIDVVCNSVAFSPDGAVLAAGTSIGIYLYDPLTFAQIGFIESAALINSVAFSPDGRLLGSGSNDGTVCLWDVATRQKVITLPERSLVTPEEALKTLAKMDLEDISLKEYFPLKRGNSWEYEVLANGVFTRNREMVLGKPERIHHPANATEAFPPDADIDQPFFVCSVTLTESDYGSFSEWYVVSGNRILYRGTISSMPWGEDARLNSLVFLEAEMIIDTEITTVPAGTFACIRIKRDNSCNLDVLPLDPTWYAPIDSMPVYEWYSEGVGMVKREYKLYDPSSKREIEYSEVLSKYALTDTVSSVSFSPNGNLLASANLDGMVSLWDVENPQDVNILEHPEGVLSVAFNPDGRLLASGSEDNTVKLWDVSSHEESATLKGHTYWVFSVAFSPDGRLLASGNSNGTVCLWNVETHQEIATLTSHPDSAFSPIEFPNIVLSVAFSPDGRLLAGGHLYGTVCLWSVNTHQEIVTFTSHSDIIFSLTGQSDILSSVAFSPDGSLLASGSADGTVCLWDVEPYTNVPAVVGPEDRLTVSWGSVKNGEYSFTLGQNYPNPFNPETWIPYQLAKDADVVIRIYDSAGRMIRKLDLGPRPAGLYLDKDKAAYWDGGNSLGERPTSGVYFYTIQVGDFFTATRKMMMAR